VLLATFVSHARAANWTKLTNPTPNGDQAYELMLLTDGTVMVAVAEGPNWLRLTPDAFGSYINGTWTSNPINPMSTRRYSYPSEVLQNGNVWILGGENYGPNADAVWTPTGEMWNSLSNTWSPIATFPPQACFNITFNVGANTTAGSDIITNIPKVVTPTFLAGWTVSGPGIPSGATITSVDSSSQIHISLNATATQSSVTLAFSGTPTSCYGDGPTMLLPGGKILAGSLDARLTYIYTIASNSWAFAANKVYNDSSDEEGWTRLADGRILTYDIGQSSRTGSSYAEVYDPVANSWSGISPADGTAKGAFPLLSSEAAGYEIGPSLRLLDGRSFLIGATGHTALYTPATNTWAAGPDIMGTLNGSPALFGADDAPAAIMPNGHVLLAADAGPTLGPYEPPTQLFDFDPAANTISPVSPAIPDTSLNTNAYQTHMLVLPTGQVLFEDGSYQLWVYTPDGAAPASYQPAVTNVAYIGSGVFTLSGTQLTGQSAGAAYGDDSEMDENYPIVSLISSSGNVYYCRTSNWSSVGVATGSTPQTVNFTLNPSITAGKYSLVVSAAGISSAPANITITQAAVSGLPLTSIAVTPANSSIAIGANQPFAATGTFTDGSTGNITDAAAWRSSVASVASISATGVAIGLVQGTTDITAAVGSIDSPSAVLNVTQPSSSAKYLGLDGSSQGAWSGKYGADGHLIANDATVPPAYATVSLAGDTTYTWAASTTDVRALQTANGATTRIASTYYSGTSYSINVNITDGNAHRIALFLLDWDSSARSETIQLLDAASNTVLDSETYSSFHSGMYAAWSLQGNVIIKVAKTGGSNAVVSGIFFDPPSAPASAAYLGVDAGTEGTWTGKYGSNGDLIANDANNLPTFATASLSANSVYTWAASTSDMRALQTASGAASRIASTNYSGSSFTINLALTDGNTHKISLYLLDWDSGARAESIQIRDAISNAVLDTETFSGFHNGEYAAWNITGHVLIQVTKTAGSNAVVSGIFVD